MTDPQIAAVLNLYGLNDLREGKRPNWPWHWTNNNSHVNDPRMPDFSRDPAAALLVFQKAQHGMWSITYHSGLYWISDIFGEIGFNCIGQGETLGVAILEALMNWRPR